MKKILIADDEHAICQAFAQMISLEGHEPLIVSNGQQALQLIEQQQPDAIFMDIQMPGLDGLETLRQLRQQQSAIPVVIMTAYGSMQTALQAVKLEAFDYLGKPVELDKARQLMRQMLDSTRPAASPDPLPVTTQGSELVGQSAPMQELFKLMGLLSSNDLTTLITGESGVGKELVARGIHHNGQNSQHPFVAVNCAAIPAELLESELFGHEKGAFSGADGQRIGRFEAAGCGTMFLDEIAEMPTRLQSKLLRVLQEHSFERIGSSSPLPMQARIIAATNRQPPQEVAAGRLREDLYHRLNVITLCVPPLRERREDIPLLAQHFLQRACQVLNKSQISLDDAALQKLQSAAWPGNVRELEHVIHRSVLLARGNIIHADALQFSEHSESASSDNTPWKNLQQSARAALQQAISEQTPPPSGGLFHALVQQVETALIEEALAACHGNQACAARLLGLHRSTLRNKLPDQKSTDSS